MNCSHRANAFSHLLFVLEKSQQRLTWQKTSLITSFLYIIKKVATMIFQIKQSNEIKKHPPQIPYWYCGGWDFLDNSLSLTATFNLRLSDAFHGSKVSRVSSSRKFSVFLKPNLKLSYYSSPFPFVVSKMLKMVAFTFSPTERVGNNQF